MLRLRLRPEASNMVVTMTATAARTISTAATAAPCVSVNASSNTITATLPVGTASSSTLSMLRKTAGNNAAMYRSAPHTTTFVVPMEASQQMRFVRAKPTSSTESQQQSSSTEQQQEKAAENEGNKNEGKTAEGEEGAKAEGEEGAEGAAKKKKETPKKSFKEQFQALKQDMKDFPDIYNSVNLVHFFIFTIFCLCSTGSNVEEQWWMRNWGIDKTFAPWAWPLHSLLTNNFLSMTFAMLLMHSMCHSAMTTLGPKLMWQYMAIVAVTSGALIWGLNAYMGWSHEKQFGPWDVCSALFVMQYLHQGMKPWQLILSFNGWVKYAMCVGSVCILYYDWQPVVFGTGIGLALCKLHPKLRGIKPPSA